MINYVNSQDLILIVPICNLQLNNIVLSQCHELLNGELIILSASLFFMDNVYQLMLQNFKINYFAMSQPFIQLNQGSNIYLNNLKITSFKLHQQVQITDKTLLIVNILTISNSQFSSSITSVNQLFQYFNLMLKILLLMVINFVVQSLILYLQNPYNLLQLDLIIQLFKIIVFQLIKCSNSQLITNIYSINQKLSLIFQQYLLIRYILCFKFSFGDTIHALHLIFDHSSFITQNT
ncbi:unnamed protein product [Paramecium sonneborni]|uniref:Transmembrane protein n=1 Tax=Paramecium sonneborni TaxID=65129 RepID=A0A8S1RV84_9CILI|nr:unnamed protein product [Paramecium sonneborni]